MIQPKYFFLYSTFCFTKVALFPFEDEEVCDGLKFGNNIDWDWIEEEALSKLNEVEAIIKNVDKSDTDDAENDIFTNNHKKIVKRDSGFVLLRILCSNSCVPLSL